MVQGLRVNEDNLLEIETTQGWQSIDGYFEITEDNSLVYTANNLPQWFKAAGYTEKISFDGSWNLNANYELEFKVKDKGKLREEGVLTLKTEIVGAENDKLSFSLKTFNKNKQTQFRILSLAGNWAVDEHNQIYFAVIRKTSPDTLTLQGRWLLSGNQEIVYRYTKTDLKKKDKSVYTVTFKGFWEITESQRLTYIFSAGSTTRFDFRVQLETPNVYPKEGTLKYRIGIGLKETVLQEPQIISLYGVWKFSRNLGLIFDMEYSEGNFHAIKFGAEVNLNKRDEISFSVTNFKGERLGFNLLFSHKFLEEFDAQAFLQLKKASEESGVYAGIRIPF